MQDIKNQIAAREEKKMRIGLSPGSIKIPCDRPRKKSRLTQKAVASLIDSKELLI